MSFLFKINGVEHEKTTKIMMVLNFIQAATAFFQFIACIMLGNIKQQTKDYLGSISETTQRTYNPLLAIFSIIGIFQTLLGVFIAVALMGKLPFLETKKRFWLSAIHYGLLAQFGFVCFICLQASTQSTIFAAINDDKISGFDSLSSSASNFKYYESFVIYGRYLSAWAIMEFLICFPIAFANLYALHTRHMNYEALMFEQEEKVEVVVQPEMQYPSVRNQQGLIISGQNGLQVSAGMRGDGLPPLESPKPLEVQMISH